MNAKEEQDFRNKLAALRQQQRRERHEERKAEAAQDSSHRRLSRAERGSVEEAFRAIKENKNPRTARAEDVLEVLAEAERGRPGADARETERSRAQSLAHKLWCRRGWLAELRPVELTCLSFVLVILLGSLLLSLPIATRSGQPAPYLTALYTATSATSVTGLVVEDTMLFWSTFGHVVIALLIQIGGISLLTIISAVSFGLHRRLALSTRVAIQNSTAADSFDSAYSLVGKILAVTGTMEGLAALLLTWRFSQYMPFLHALKKACFQAVSAFCNAGFDLMGDYSGPYSSLSAFQHDPVVLLVTALLLISGGLGFVLWTDPGLWRRGRRMSFHSRLVLSVSAFLLVLGTVFFFFVERHGEIGGMPFGERLLNSFFQSASLRTAGFNSVDQGALEESSKMLGGIWMIIGAGPASTGGGIKVTTLALLLAALRQDLVASSAEIHLLRHRISPTLIRRSSSIFMLALTIVCLLTLILKLSDPAGSSLIDCFYEASSAFGTVGLSATGSAHWSVLGKLALIVTMYIGRVGPVALALSFMTRHEEQKYTIYPEGKTFVG